MNRLKIISRLRRDPLNANQLANETGLDCVRHHMRVFVGMAELARLIIFPRIAPD